MELLTEPAVSVEGPGFLPGHWNKKDSRSTNIWMYYRIFYIRWDAITEDV